MSKKDAYEKKMQAQLDEWTAEIDRLKAKAEKAEADTKLDLHEKIEEANASKEQARDKLEEIKNAGDDAWEDMQAGLQGAWQSLDAAVQSAKSRFA